GPGNGEAPITLLLLRLGRWVLGFWSNRRLWRRQVVCRRRGRVHRGGALRGRLRSRGLLSWRGSRSGSWLGRDGLGNGDDSEIGHIVPLLERRAQDTGRAEGAQKQRR